MLVSREEAKQWLHFSPFLLQYRGHMRVEFMLSEGLQIWVHFFGL